MALIDYKSGDRLVGFFAVRRFDRREHNGTPYLTLNVADRTASVNAVMWDGFAEVVESLKVGSVVKIQGMLGEYRNAPQIKIERIRLALDHEFDPSDFLALSAIPAEELAARLDKIIGSVSDDHLHSLLTNLFGEQHLREDFLTAPGGKKVHHASIGGLAEHTFGVVAICELAVSLYPGLDRELLVTGGLLHDIGKIKQYQVSSVFEYTDSGRLLGHVVEGDEMVGDAIKNIEGFPADRAMLLRHLILSHQGQYEFQAPILPQTREAFVLYFADQLDSTMGQLANLEKKSGDKPWSEYERLLGRFIYFGKERETAQEE